MKNKPMKKKQQTIEQAMEQAKPFLGVDLSRFTHRRKDGRVVRYRGAPLMDGDTFTMKSS